jgi:Dolichyl-phosphate-mannose-protein mannosyltransferase
LNAMAATRARALAIPAWVWLGAIVILSAAVRIALARRIVAPWIMVDEIDYSELAKSFAAQGHFLVRGVPSNGYGFVYPLLIAPAYKLFEAVPDAYRAAKAINAVVMSLAAIPAYFLARRVLSASLALVVAALTVLIPSMLYTGELMTENAFYPIFLLCALALVLALERPTPLRQVVLLVLCGLAYATRAQAAALVPAIVCAPILLVWIERRGLRGLRPFATLYGILAAGVLLAVLGEAARGRSPLSLLGAYRAATSSSYSTGRILHFLVYHLAELDLYLGVVPFAALLALWFAPRAASPAARVFAAASLPLVFFLIVEVAAFASQTSVDKIEERNMFYVAPLFFVALLGLAADNVVPRRRVPLVAAAAIAAVLPVFIPYAHFITTSATADTFALLPWWWVQDHGVQMTDIRWATLGAGIVGAALFLWVPRRLVLVLPALVAVYLVATTFVVDNGRHGIHVASLGKLWAGIRVAHPDWIDRAVGPHAAVSVLYTGSEEEVTWENEFFNRSVGDVYDYDAPAPDPLPATAVVRRSDGALVASGTPVKVQYVLAPTGANVKGKLIALDGTPSDNLGYGLYRVNGPLVVLSSVAGLYPDTWSHRYVTYRLVDCTGGRLSVQLQSDPSLFKAANTVTATEDGHVVGSTTVSPMALPTLTVPLHPSNGVCTVRFRVSKLLNPSRVEPGSTDNRLVGVHFLAFTPHA